MNGDTTAAARNSLTGMITDVQHFSVHDGPGIRTTVFVKGCNLRCFWCHNPETLESGPELQYFQDRCISCGNCVPVCPESAHSMTDGAHAFDRERCTACGACADVCYPRALAMIGTRRDAADIVEIVLRDRAYYEQSGGGVTISGGEPLLQLEFTRAVLEGCRQEGVHTAIETAANVSWSRIERILSVTDLVMMDIKTMDSEAHRRATGAPNERILENATRLSQMGVPLIVRTPVVPGVNSDTESIRCIAEFVSGLDSVVSYELLRFHSMAASKYASLGRSLERISVQPPSTAEMASLAAAASAIEPRTRVEKRRDE